MDGFSIVMTACADGEKARPIIDALLEGRLAACIQALPVQSHYIWDGAVQHEGEVLLLIKCAAEKYDAIEETILRLHDYELPEIVQVPIAGGLDRYLDWIAGPRQKADAEGAGEKADAEGAGEKADAEATGEKADAEAPA